MDTRLYLKIKIKSLAEEARIIRKEENKQRELRKNPVYPREKRAETYFWGLRAHRHNDVGIEQRATLLAYGFLNGKSYAQIEGNSFRTEPAWDRVRAMIRKYGDRSNWYTDADLTELEKWIAASGWVKGRREH